MLNFKSGYKLWLTGIVICFALAGCDSPSGSFERLNSSDPGSVTFEDKREGDYDLELGFSADRNMTLVWGELEDFIDKVVVQKSLGDSLSYTTVAELESFGTQWQDTSRVIDRFIYYKIETYYTRNGVEYTYGKASLEEQLGEILDFSFEINNENESLDLRWEVDTSFFDSFVLESDHMISENGDKRVEIPFSTLETEISIKDPDISFSQRNYTLTGVIEGVNGQEDILVSSELTANLKSSLKPANLSLEIIDEQDWLLSWEGAPYFADKVVVRRNGYDGNWYDREFQPNKESLLDTLLSVPEFPLVNNDRQYLLTFEDKEAASDTSYVVDYLIFSQPYLIDSPSSDPSVSSLDIKWVMPGSNVDKIKEFIIEKWLAGSFKEVGRVSGDKRRFTYSSLDITKEPIFRVSSLTSNYSPPKRYQYVHDYSRILTLETNISEFATTQITSDNQYFTGLSYDGKLIEIWDLNSGEKVYDYRSEFGLISDFKISHDNQHIYYVIPEIESIYRADFPTWSNVTEVIDDALFSGATFEMDGHPIRKIDVSSDGEYMLGVGLGYVKRWSLNTYELDYTKRYENIPFHYRFNIDISNDNQTFVASGSGIFLLNNTSDGSTIREYEAGEYITDLSFSSLNKFISARSGNETFIFRSDSEGTYRRLPGSTSVNFDPDDDNILLIGERAYNHNENKYNYGTYFYDLEEEKRVENISDKNLNGPGFLTRFMSFIDSDRVIIGFSGEEGALEIWKKAESKQWKMK